MEYPNGKSGTLYRLEVRAQSEDGRPDVAGKPTNPGRGLPKNQGEVKFEDVPGRYKLTFSKPSDPNEEYVVTAYQCGSKASGTLSRT